MSCGLIVLERGPPVKYKGTVRKGTKRLLLINPSMNLSLFGRFRWLMEPMPPTGLAYLAAVGEDEGWGVRVIDQFTTGESIDRIITGACHYDPHVVGITCLTPSAPVANRLGYALKKRLPGTKVIFGNIHASIFYRDVLRRGYCDAVVHGEGEEALREIMERVSSGGDLEGIRGVSTARGCEGGETPAPAAVRDRDELPFPAWHYFPFERYGLLPFANIRRPILSILGSSGCPFKCEFCSLIHGGAFYRARDPVLVAEEFEYLHERYGVKQIGFVDPIFPLKKGMAKKFCDDLLRRGMSERVVWSCETRIDMLDEELILIMKEAGCRRILFGLESGVESLLKGVRKVIRVDETKERINFIKRTGIEPVGLFMIGLPGETVEDTEKTIRYARELDLNFAKFAITVPFPGSPMYDRMRRNGEISREDWENFTTFNPHPERVVYTPEGLTPHFLIEMQKRGTLEFYSRPGIVFNHLFRVKSLTMRNIISGLYGLIP